MCLRREMEGIVVRDVENEVAYEAELSKVVTHFAFLLGTSKTFLKGGAEGGRHVGEKWRARMGRSLRDNAGL